MQQSFESGLIFSVMADRDDYGPVVYRPLENTVLERESFRGREMLVVPSSTLKSLAYQMARDANFLLRSDYLEQLKNISQSNETGKAEQRVLRALLHNAVVAAKGEFPLCQDTGTVCLYGLKGSSVFVEHRNENCDALLLSEGIGECYRDFRFRASQLMPHGLFEEKNSGDNLPAPIELFQVDGSEYRLLMIIKGGGSSNKTALFQENKAILAPEAFDAFLRRVIPTLGVSACPPYHIAIAVGGQSPEETCLAAKLAASGFLDALPDGQAATGMPVRARDQEKRVLAIAAESGWGAQFGGSRLAIDARVVRLTRHAASCPVAISVSCCAHRQIRAKITREGVFIEELERNPARFLPVSRETDTIGALPAFTLPGGLRESAAALAKFSAGDFIALSGKVILARDAAHARMLSFIQQGENLPEWATRYPIFYAAPSGAPEGHPIGSLGPTTSKRMDPYFEALSCREASLVMIGKGERGSAFSAACRAHGAVYLAAIGGAAALYGSDHILSCEILDWNDLGMEAVRLVELRALPVMVAVDARGNDFYGSLSSRYCR